MKQKKLFFLVAFLAVVSDQITKYIIVHGMTLYQSIPVLDNVLDITYIVNTGAGFGILPNMNSVLIWVYFIIIGLIFFFYDKIPHDKIPQIFLGLVVGGAIGNLVDRIIAGHVIDFIDFRVWPVFNLADSWVSIGVIGLIVYFWKR